MAEKRFPRRSKTIGIPPSGRKVMLHRHRHMIFLKFKDHRCPIEHTGIAAAVATRAKREIGSFSASAAPPSLMLPIAVAISIWLAS